MSTLRQNFGVYIIALWSLILGALNLLRLFYTSGVGFSQFQVQISGPLLYVYQWASLIFGLLFLAAAFGLLKIKNWGRLLFFAAATLYFIISIFGVWVTNPGDLPFQQKLLLTGRYALSIILPLIYLNLPFIKAIFFVSDKQTTGENDG